MTTALRSNRIGTTCVHLGDLCSPDLEQVLPGTADVQAMPYVGMEDIESNTGRVLGSSHQGEVRSNTFAFDTRHVLYGKLRPYLNKVALPDRSGRCSTELIPLLPAYGVDRQYLAWLLRRPQTVSAAMQGKTGSRMPRANMSELFSLTVPLFLLPEQKRIAAKLNQQMATLARAQAALAAQREATTALRSAVLRTALDPATHPHWPMVSISSICNLNPVRPPLVRRDSEPTSFVPMSAVDELAGTISKVAERPYGEVKKGYTYFQEGDVLFAKITPCMQNGKSAIARGLVDHLGFGSTEFHVLRPSAGVTSEWIHLWLRQQRVLEDAARHFTGAVGQQRVPADYLALLNIPLPPLSEQHCIAEFLDNNMKKMDALVVSLDNQASTLDSLRTSLLDAAFSGKV